MTEKALIFGMDSFTGPYLKAELESLGIQVYGTALKQGFTESSRVFTCDIRDRETVRALMSTIRPSMVAVLSAVTFVPEGTDRTIYDINLFAPLNILDILSENPSPCVRILIPGTSHVYGNRRGGRLDEKTSPDPISHYALSKFAMEQMARAYAGKVEVVIPRPFNYTGLGQPVHFLVPKLVDHFRRRAPFMELGNLHVSRDFSDVRDVARAYALLMTMEQPPSLVNIASGQPFSIREILGMLEEMTGHAMEIRVNPAFVRENEILSLCGDNGLLRACGWTPQYTLKDTLMWMLGLSF
ncbi:nucleoside-diphosphate-sugar epimerase [Desulfobotulus alkaliphilus]|uniref:Nucleoside-diphosphate-sugar epimerase n=1 Tax=Desulfobotulus alkaliphilus TaxID=622671 RepID=A0A562RCD2_9BACT|nr:GDP-mannose 4,6-dehydratase [Desulfobotulus alkaliphilus]TWI66066.1 nucleoside-diphosphate-sugar epimerase [Desulfobotulus alkaliphilus]